MFIPSAPKTARATLLGSPMYPNIRGTVTFRQTARGVLISADISGLPEADGVCDGRFFGFHIHEGSECSGTAADPFANTLSHYNPSECPHPFHAGDLPPLLGASGHAVGVCLSDRFTVPEIIGKTVVIHSEPDDFSTQPAGNSGIKIACGEIRQ